MVERKSLFSQHEAQEFDTFLDEFLNESDRAAVVLGASKIDTQLYQILQRSLIPCPSNRDELLDGDGPLSSFSSRINMVHRLGLIDDQLSWALHLIRKIRNAFAHELSGVSLVSGPHRDRVRELVAPLKSYSGFEELKKIYEEKTENLEEPSADFRLTIALCSAGLHRLFSDIQTPVSARSHPYIPPRWKETDEENGESESKDDPE